MYQNLKERRVRWIMAYSTKSRPPHSHCNDDIKKTSILCLTSLERAVSRSRQMISSTLFPSPIVLVIITFTSLLSADLPLADE